MLDELHEALVNAGADEDAARRAASGVGQQLARMDQRLQRLETAVSGHTAATATNSTTAPSILAGALTMTAILLGVLGILVGQWSDVSDVPPLRQKMSYFVYGCTAAICLSAVTSATSLWQVTGKTGVPTWLTLWPLAAVILGVILGTPWWVLETVR